MTTNPSQSSEEDRRKVTDYEEYWNSYFSEKPIQVGIMQHKFSSNEDEMLITTVGRGIAVCLNDKTVKAGGLAHILPLQSLTNSIQAFETIIDDLLNPIISDLITKGSTPENIKAKLFGGGQLQSDDLEEHAQRTCDIVRSYLGSKSIAISMDDIGNTVGRRIHFFPKNGKVVRRLLQRQIDRDALIEREKKFSQNYSI